MQLAKSGAEKRDLIESWAGRLHLPQIDFCKSRVSNIPSQNALIESSLWSISGTPPPLPVLAAAIPSKKCFQNPPRRTHSRFSRQASFGRDLPLCADWPDNNLLSQQHQQEEWVFQYPVHTLAHPSPALHQEIEGEEGGGEHQKKKKKKKKKRQTASGGQEAKRALGRDSCSGERCARCAGGDSALGPVVNPVSRNKKHPQLASPPRAPPLLPPSLPLCLSFSLSLAGYAHDITASPPAAGA